jgi:hypothetical protein
MEDIARPIKQGEEIDRDILKNLSSLWRGSTEEELVAALVQRDGCVSAGDGGRQEHIANRKLYSEQGQLEKSFYYLLKKHKAKQLENYNKENETEKPIVGE